MAVLLRDTPVATFSTYFYNRLLWHSALEAFKAARILGAGPAAKTVFRRMSIGFSPFPELCGGVFFDNFYVSEVHRRLSIGRRILEWMSIKCIESGIDSFGCDVEASNMAAIDLYKKGGGSIVRTVNPRRWVPVNAAHQIIFNAR